MSARCRCCNAELNHIDLRMTQEDGSPEDFCGECRGVVNRIDEPEEKEYRFQDLREGITPIAESDY